MGRTSLFQKVWQVKLNKLAGEYPKDARFQIHRVTDEVTQKIPAFLRFVGGISSKYYLIGAPFIFCLIWLSLLVYFPAS